MALGTHHLTTLDTLEKGYIQFATSSTDLRLAPEYQALFPDLYFPNA